MDDFQSDVLQRLTRIETLFEDRLAGVATVQQDHEARLRAQETLTTRAAGAASIWGVAGAILFSIAKFAWTWFSGAHH